MLSQLTAPATSQLAEVTEFRTVTVLVDQDERRVYVAADDHGTTGREWRQVLAWLASNVGTVSLEDNFEYAPGTTSFVRTGSF
jgi:hypothetical protein